MSASKDTKRGTWKVYIRYKDWQGIGQVHTKRGFATKREALEYEREFLLKKSKDRISNETVAIVAHWLLFIIVIVGAAVAVGVLIVIAEKKVAKVYRENCWDVISVGVVVTSVALVVYFGDWIKGFVKLNLVVLLLLVQAVYVGIRAYVKGCKRARGYY